MNAVEPMAAVTASELPLGRVGEPDDGGPGPLRHAGQGGQGGADVGVVVGVAGHGVAEPVDGDHGQAEVGDGRLQGGAVAREPPRPLVGGGRRRRGR